MSLNSDLDNTLEPMVRVLSEALTATIEGHLVTAYISGDRELMTWGMTKSGIPIAYEGPPMEQAINYAKKHGAKMVTNMDEETKRRLAKIVSDGIKNKRGVAGLARDLRGEFKDMSKARSLVIARTETANGLETAFMERSKAMGVTGKEWLFFGGECGICADCAGQGKVPIDFEYSHLGEDPKRPPAHPNCQCALAPVMLK